MNKNKLIPDWRKPEAVALVWPEHIGAGRGKLKGFYKNFIYTLSNYVPVKVLFGTGDDKFEPPKSLLELDNVNIFPITQIGDIWLRDYSPFPVKVANEIIPYKAKYQPNYHHTPGEKRDGKIDNEIGNKLSRDFYKKELEILKVENTDIILDGGNFIHNGKGTAVITNRIISDNEHFFIEDLKESLFRHLGIEELHIIPTESGDDTGHADGLIRFINPSHLIVSEYPYPWKSGKGYIPKEDYSHSIEVVDAIANYFIGKNFSVTRMPNGVPKDSETFESAEGNYTNFLRVGDLVFLPEYGKKEQDQNAIDALIKAGIKENNIIGVPDCSKLAQFGGVLNCITTHIYR